MCLVIMSISDPQGYETGHFERVYDYLLKPACERAGFTPFRPDKVAKTNYIVIDILKRILDTDLVLCDLSASNPNVFYELGVRQAFNKRVTLVKDEITDKVFDIQGLRFIEYSQDLRTDHVEKDVERIAQALRETSESGPDDVNSLLQLLGVQAAAIPSQLKLSEETSLILDGLQDLAGRVGKVEDQITGVSRGFGLRDVSSARNYLRRLWDIDKAPGADYIRLKHFVETNALRYAMGEKFFLGEEEFGTLVGHSDDRRTLIFETSEGVKRKVSIDNAVIGKLARVPS